MRKQLRHVRGEDVGEKIADIGEDGAAFFYRGDDAREVAVEQHHVGGFARQVGATAAHGDADVGLPQGRCVVHAVARHGDNRPLLFQRADDAHFLFRKDASKTRSPWRRARAGCPRDARYFIIETLDDVMGPSAL
jgi:hypothetical protein